MSIRDGRGDHDDDHHVHNPFHYPVLALVLDTPRAVLPGVEPSPHDRLKKAEVSPECQNHIDRLVENFELLLLSDLANRHDLSQQLEPRRYYSTRLPLADMLQDKGFCHFSQHDL